MTALGLACHALLREHPNNERAVQSMHATLEGQIAALLASELSDEMQSGIEAARDQYLLKKPADPGQPRVT